MSGVSSDLLTDLLKSVSRSFYLTMRVLPSPVRSQIGLAYLLARTTDTIADTEILPADERLTALASLRDRILGVNSHPLAFDSIAERQTSSAEKTLLMRSEESMAVLESFPETDRQRIRDVLRVIVSGQELDLRRFAAATERNIVALTTAEEVDDYTYRVAGCVGEFWTKICRAHLFPEAQVNEAALVQDGIRFGKGLQLVNILRDLPRDLRQGRCYLPEPELAGVGLKPADLLDPKNESQFRRLYNRYLNLADDHIAAGWTYTLSLPRNQRRLRLACAWPILIADRTLRKLRTENPLDASHRIKVSRKELRRMMAYSILTLPFSDAWSRQYVGRSSA